MQFGFAAGRTDLADLRREIQRRDWAIIGVIVALFGAMAQGFGWLH
jgi:predicted Abi (CAAX) family protease